MATISLNPTLYSQAQDYAKADGMSADHGVGSTDHFSALKNWMFENKFVSLPSHLKTIEPMEVHRESLIFLEPKHGCGSPPRCHIHVIDWVGQGTLYSLDLPQTDK